MARESSFLLDALLAMLIAILAWVALRKVFFPSGKSFFDEARSLLGQRMELREQVDGVKRQFALGELDSKHYRAAINHLLQELAVIERKLKRLGFG